MKKIVSLKNISYSYKTSLLSRKKNKFDNALKKISLEWFEGETLGIAGESGSGKTTLIKIICGILPDYTGEVVFPNSNRSENNFLTLFQNSEYLLNPLRTVKSILTDAIKRKNSQADASSIQNILLELLTVVNLREEALNKKVFQLSGGQNQRIALARLLALEPTGLILDEPFSSQDPQSREILIDILNRLKASIKISVICVSHDILALRNISDRIAIMREGEILETRETQALFSTPRNEYTNFLIEASRFKLTKTEIENFYKDAD